MEVSTLLIEGLNGCGCFIQTVNLILFIRQIKGGHSLLS